MREGTVALLVLPLVLAVGVYCGWAWGTARAWMPRWKEGFDQGYENGRLASAEAFGAELGRARADTAREQARAARLLHALQDVAAGKEHPVKAAEAKQFAAAYETWRRQQEEQAFHRDVTPPPHKH